MNVVFVDAAYRWFYQLPVGKQRAIKRAVKILERAGMHTDNALGIIYEHNQARAYDRQPQQPYKVG